MKKQESKKAPKRGNAEWWRALIAAQAASGQSIKTFCVEQGINTSSYYRWRKLLNGKEGEGFSPIELERAPLPLLEMVVDLPGGLSVRFSSLPPASYLHSLSESFNTGER